MIACSHFSRLSRLSISVSVTNALCIRLSPFQDCFCGRRLSYVPMSGGKKVGQCSLNKCKKQTVAPVWRPISSESGNISKVMKSGSTDPIMDTINSENSSPGISTDGLVATLAYEAVDYRSELEPLKGKEIVNEAEKHSISIQVDAPLIHFVKGKWGLTQKQIEEETGVKIIFPSTEGDSSVVIEGASMENVNRASEKITNVLQQAVESPNLDYSHFVSLPLAFHPKLVEKLDKFQKSVLEEVNMKHGDITTQTGSSVFRGKDKMSDADIDRSIFIKPQTFHLTVLMLKLWNKERVAMATKILKEISLKIMDALENRPVSIRLRGLACMRGSPANANVIYAPVEEVSEDGRLLRACQVIIDAYVEAGLVLQKDARHSLKLHATLMNTRHRKRKMNTRSHDSFDARGIFKKYGSEDWGEYVIREAHLSQRYVFDESGYYHCCGSIPFPRRIEIM